MPTSGIASTDSLHNSANTKQPHARAIARLPAPCMNSNMSMAPVNAIRSFIPTALTISGTNNGNVPKAAAANNRC